MYKVIVAFAVVAAVVGITSCSKNKTETPVVCIPSDTVNTYTKSVKDVLDLYCAFAGCHGGGSASAGIALGTYQDAVNSAKNNDKFFCVIDHSCGPIMPPGGPKIPQVMIQKIVAWRDNCYPE